MVTLLPWHLTNICPSCSPWFGLHSIVKSLASWFQFEPKLSSTNCLGLSSKIVYVVCHGGLPFLWQKNCFVSRNSENFAFWQQWNCIVQLQKTKSPIIYDELDVHYTGFGRSNYQTISKSHNFLQGLGWMCRSCIAACGRGWTCRRRKRFVFIWMDGNYWIFNKIN